MREIVTAVRPEFVRVAVCAGVVLPNNRVPNFRSDVEKITAVPVPVSVVTCGDVGSLSVMVRVPVLVPVAVGLKTTLMLHIRGPGDGGGRELGHVSVSEKSPVVAMLEMSRLEEL
jgi:hypothetical protein